MDKSIINKLKSITGDPYLLTEPEDMVTYSYDAAVLDAVLPSAVAMPGNSDELGQIIEVCNENSLPITVRGAGTNLSGGTIPSIEGVIILTSRLNSIIEINKEDMFAIVQPGVVTANLSAQAEKLGLFYPPDPASLNVSTIWLSRL